MSKVFIRLNGIINYSYISTTNSLRFLSVLNTYLGLVMFGIVFFRGGQKNQTELSQIEPNRTESNRFKSNQSLFQTIQVKISQK